LTEHSSARERSWQRPAGDALATRRGLVFLAVMLATFMIANDSYIVATAMPTIVSDLGGFRLFSWVFAAYLLAQAVTIPIYGRLADLYGRKRIFFIGAGIFLIGSTLCGFAWGMVPLICFRAVQGIGAGAIQPIATTIVGDIFAPVERARMQGYISGVFGIASIFGPTFGAFFVEQISWSLIFWINLPFGIATCVMFGRYLNEARERHEHRIDYLGSVLMMLGIGGPMLAVVLLRNADTATLLGLAGIGAVALVALAWHERDAPEPMLPFRLWRNRVVAIGCLAGFFNGAVMMALSGFIPTFVQGAMGQGATASGIALAASSIAWAVASFVSGRLMIRTSYRLAATIGGLCLVAGCLVLTTLDPASSLVEVSAGAFLLGTGMGFCNTAFSSRSRPASAGASAAWRPRRSCSPASSASRSAPPCSAPC